MFENNRWTVIIIDGNAVEPFENMGAAYIPNNPAYAPLCSGRNISTLLLANGVTYETLNAEMKEVLHYSTISIRGLVSRILNRSVGLEDFAKVFTPVRFGEDTPIVSAENAHG